MTEFWKSNSMHWCDVCRCWMNDTKAAIQHHERGMGHTEALKRKLRDMTRKADQDKRTAEHIERSMQKIDHAAMKQYTADLRAAEAETGRWTWDVSSGYYYNAQHGWYYDPKTEWYYGGDPQEWSQSPAALPETARFEAAPHEGGPVASKIVGPGMSSASAASSSGRLAPASTRPSSGPGAAPGAASGPSENKLLRPVKVVEHALVLPKHPHMNVGGHSGPTIGRVGAAKGLTDVSSAPKLTAAAEAVKRQREADAAAGRGALSAEEAAALARREAAKNRVAQRTAQGFGYA